MGTEVAIELDSVALRADLTRPDEACGVVAFAHGSGSGRRSPRNRAVAEALSDAGLATLLADLLTDEEEARDLSTAELRFDIDLLTARVVALVDWLAGDPRTAPLPIGCFGASTGAAAALRAAVERPEQVAAVVSRGGRPDLAGPALTGVTAPTLLIVGGADDAVIELNEHALPSLPGKRRLELVPGAGHLFEESGALEQVAALARAWFLEHLEAPIEQPRAGRPGPDHELQPGEISPSGQTRPPAPE